MITEFDIPCNRIALSISRSPVRALTAYPKACAFDV